MLEAAPTRSNHPNLYQVMKSATPYLLMASLLLVLAIGNLIQLRTNRDLREKVAELETRVGNGDLSDPAGSPDGGSGKSKRKIGGSKSKAGADGGPGGSQLAAASKKDGEGESLADITEKYAKSVEDNPAIQKQLLAQFEAQLGGVLDDLYSDLELEGDELAHFKGLIAEHWRVQSQVPMQLMSAMGNPEKTAEIKEGLKESREDIDSRIEEFLNNDDDFDYYKTYRDQIPDRMEVVQYRDAMADGGVALDADQEAQLIAAMAEERKASGLGDVNDPMQWETDEFNQDVIDEVMGQMTDFHERVQVRAGGILEQDQISILADSQKDIRQHQELGMQFGLRMMEAMRPKEAGASAGE